MYPARLVKSKHIALPVINSISDQFMYNYCRKRDLQKKKKTKGKLPYIVIFHTKAFTTFYIKLLFVIVRVFVFLFSNLANVSR